MDYKNEIYAEKHQWWRQQVTNGSWGAWFNHAGALVSAWGRMESPMRPILLHWCTSEKDDSDDGSDELIEAILMACGKATKSLTSAWPHVDGQMMMILVALCRSVEKLLGDMSYVLIGNPMWKIRQRQWSWWWWSSFWRWRFNLGTFDGSGAVKRGYGKGLLTDEVEVAKNTNKDKTARHKKVRTMALIPC